MGISKTQKFYNQRAVTLVELSISIAIITLMVAGTFGGISMLKAAKIRKAVSEFTANMSAINEFQLQYAYLPGDLPNASSYWTGAHDGDGDGIVDQSNEDLYTWEHLGNAKLIPGSFTGLYSDTPTNTIKYGPVNSINSEPFAIGVYGFSTIQTSPIYNTSGQALKFAAYASGTSPDGAVMSAKDAYSIDVKVDDGLASAGMFYAVRAATNCTDAASTAASANYNLSDATIDCKLSYWQKKF